MMTESRRVVGRSKNLKASQDVMSVRTSMAARYIQPRTGTCQPVFAPRTIKNPLGKHRTDHVSIQKFASGSRYSPLLA
jgi:hypothetical protein